MRPPLSAASALRPHSSASIDRHKLPSLHSHNTSLPTLYLPSQGQGQGPNESYSLQDVGLFVSFSALLTVTLACSNCSLYETLWDRIEQILLCVCTTALNIEWLICCLHLQPTVVQPYPADCHTASPLHVQLGFTDQSNYQAVSNGLYTPIAQSAQVMYMHGFSHKWSRTSVLQLKLLLIRHSSPGSLVVNSNTRKNNDKTSHRKLITGEQ